MELRNASVKLPADLHQQIKDELEAKNITMSQFFEMAAKEHFDKEKGGKTMANGRTLAFTVSEELFQRVKEYLAWHERTYHRRLTQKEFVLGLIEDSWKNERGYGGRTAAKQRMGAATAMRMKQAGKRHCAPRRAAHRPKKQPERTRIPQSAKQRRTAKKVHTMLKNFAEKVIRRDTKHNGRKTPRRMAKTMTPRGFFCLQKGGMSVGGKMTGLKFL
ncbi:hypothetical protein [Ruthenibacterium lactatiformans]|uniref:hypothetical protein n=1 Tax=Ruthenibacterium lactatiformans TaxID=1550024 RepID=UPI0039A35DF6